MAVESVEMLFARYGPGYRWLVTATAMVAMFAMVLSSTSVNVAVPDIMGAYGVGQDQAQWVSTGFLAATTTGMLLNAWLVNSFGQRMTLMVTLVLFMVGAFISGFATTIEMIVVGRVMQGTSAGIMQPLALQTIFTVFPADRRGTAVGMFGMGVVLAPATGPLFGGLAIDEFEVVLGRLQDMRGSVMFLPVPACLIGLFLGSLFMPSRAWPERLPSFDWTGFALIATAIGCLLSAVANGQREGWSSDSIVLQLTVSAVTAVGFIAWELRVRSPLLDLSIFMNPQFACVAMVGVIFGMGMFGSIYVIAVFVQTIQSYSATRAGLLLLPSGLLMVMANPIAGRLADFIPPYRTIIVGLVIFGIGFFLMSLADPNTPFWVFVFFTLVNRLGLATIIPSLNTTALRALTPQQLAQGSGAVNFLRMLGGACGVNMLVAFLEGRTRYHSESLTATQTFSNETSRELLGHVRELMHQAGVAETAQAPGALHYLGQMVYAQANAVGFQDTYLAMAVIAWVALIPAFMLRRAYLRRIIPPVIVPTPSSGGRVSGAPAE